MEHKCLETELGTVHYWLSRCGDPDAPCIVFTHGVTADHRMFERQLPFFTGRYTVLLWDVPLHGLSRPWKGFSYRNTAEVLHAILDQENLSAVWLVGMSMGGYPSQQFGIQYPEMVRGFVALDTTPFGKCYYSKSDLWWLRQAAPMARWFPEELLRWSMARSVSQTDWSYQMMRKMLEPLSKTEITEQMRVAYEYFARENVDAAFPFPVLILVGENDSTGKVKAYCKTWSKRTGYPLRWIKNAKHFSNGDNPEEVNREIETFIAEHA